MDLVTDTSLCEILGFDLDSEFSNVRRYAKTQIKYVKSQVQDALDAMGGEMLEPLSTITDKIESSVNDMLSAIADDPFTTAANTILNCIGTNLTSYNFSLTVPNWKDMLDDWLMGILDSFLSDSEKLLWGYLDQLEEAFSPYVFDKIMALAACLIGCPGVSGATTPGPDGWGVVTPQGWVYITQSEFADVVNTVGLGTDAKLDFDVFGASGGLYGSRVRTVQDNKNNAVNALAAVATGTVASDSNSQQLIDDYTTLTVNVDDAYDDYLGVNEDILELLRLSSDNVKEVDIYIDKVSTVGTRNYRLVAESAKVKMLSIYDDVDTYNSNAIANNASALTAYDELDLTTLQGLIITNTGYKDSANLDKNRIKHLKNIVRDMANALEDKGTIGGAYSSGVKIRGRESIKDATGTGSYQEEIDAV